MTPESRSLTESTWYGNHTASEDVTLTRHGSGAEHGSSHLHEAETFQLAAGTEFSIAKMTSEHAFLVQAGQTIVIARSEIGNILVR